MQRAAAIIGSAIFLVIAPGTLAVYIPWYLTHWYFGPPLFAIARVLGATLIVAGLPILLDSFARFALQGLGTPAPVMPPKRLVVTGFYRYVRNPMYVAVTALIAGQGLLFGSVTVLEYGAILWAGFFFVRCRLRRACAGRAVRRRVQALPSEREAMVTAHHPMARVGGRNFKDLASAQANLGRRCEEISAEVDLVEAEAKKDGRHSGLAAAALPGGAGMAAHGSAIGAASFDAPL